MTTDQSSTAVDSDSRWLSSRDAQNLAARLGIPIPPWGTATNADQAVEAAQRIGLPVALKLDSAYVVHKAEVGAVKLGLSTPDAVREGYAQLRALDITSESAPIFVQKMTASGGTEMIAGYFTDATFGPVVMVGSGGTLVELSQDVAFRLCPITETDAEEMLRSLRSYPLLNGFRGTRPANLTAVARVLVAIGGADGLEMGEDGISELEINPLIVAGSMLSAVDIRAKRCAGSVKLPPAGDRSAPDLDALFHPSSIAVVGASRSPNMANRILKHLVDHGYNGEVYPVNPAAEGSELFGRAVRPSLKDLPAPVDYGIIAVPAKATSQVIREAAGHLRFAQVITSGFGEVGSGGREMEAELLAAARTADIRIVGPNCLGVHSSEARLTFVDNVDTGLGPVSVISQSGGLGADVLRQGQARGIRFNKVVTIGNAVDLGAEDFLEYLIADSGTGVIGLYLEGIRNGRRLAALLKAAEEMHKRVVILRGGRSTQGAAAAASHTGVMATEDRLWTALAAQTRCKYVDSLSQFLSVLTAMAYLSPADGDRLLLVGPSGGASVLAADYCSRLSLELPTIPPRTQQQLVAMGIPPGTSLKNPIDTPSGTLAVEQGALIPRIVKTVVDTCKFDFVLIHLNAQNALSYTGEGELILSNVASAVQRLREEFAEVSGAPQILLALRTNGEPAVQKLCMDIAHPLQQSGLTVFLSLDDALEGLRAVIRERPWPRFSSTNL